MNLHHLPINMSLWSILTWRIHIIFFLDLALWLGRAGVGTVRGKYLGGAVGNHCGRGGAGFRATGPVGC